MRRCWHKAPYTVRRLLPGVLFAGSSLAIFTPALPAAAVTPTWSQNSPEASPGARECCFYGIRPGRRRHGALRWRDGPQRYESE